MKKLSLFLIVFAPCAFAMDMSDPNPTIDADLLKDMDESQMECVLSHGCKIPTDEDVAYWEKTFDNPRPEDVLNRQCLRGAMRDCGVGEPIKEKDSGVMMDAGTHDIDDDMMLF